jgi:hypothetical protein
MILPTDDQLRWLESIGDPDELARNLVESGLLGDTDERVEHLVRWARTGRGESARLVASLHPAPRPKKGQKRHRQRLERVLRHRGLWAEPSGGQGASEDSPMRSDHELPPQEQRSVYWPPLPSYDGDRVLAAHLFENGPKLWPHIKGISFPPPLGYMGGRRMVNPFASPPPARRPSTLSALHTRRLYNALAFAMWQHGAIMNAHVIILWELMGVHDHRRAAKIMGLYLNEAQKWVRSRDRQQTLHWVYVHEIGAGRGFHSHILTCIPRHLRNEFEEWSRTALARLARRDEIAGKAFRLVGGRRDNDADAVRRCWLWFRYVTKQVSDQESFVIRNADGRRETVAVRKALRPWAFRSSGHIECAQLAGGSHSIWTKAQARAGFCSWLDQGLFERIYLGDEIEIFRREQALASAPEPWNPGFSLGS